MARELEERKLGGRLHAHSVTLENRERAVFTGVEDVDSFNEDEVILMTEAGMIILQGEDLHISRLNLDEGQLVVEGYVYSMEYTEKNSVSKKPGFFGKLFK